MKIVECVANVSEGRNQKSIEAISDAVAAAGGSILHVDSSPSAERSVITFAALPDFIADAAFNLIDQASQLIDMRRYTGVHPCIGAADVVPLVPLFDTTLEECVVLADKLARRAGRELQLPVFLYGASAGSDERRRLAYYRQGGYGKLVERVQLGQLTPDYGPLSVASPGASIIGARPLMIAYNITLDSRSAKQASMIAARIRTSGSTVRDRQGQIVRIPGCFQGCEAIGWYMEDFDRAQVSVNVRDFRSAPLHLIYEKTREIADELGTSVVGSEIIGLVPRDALLMAGRFYGPPGADDETALTAGIKGLALSHIKAFDPAERVLEMRLAASGYSVHP